MTLLYSHILQLNFSSEFYDTDKDSLNGGVDSSYASRRESLSSEMAGLAAPDDTRVLTLAEQIIAALPERIKVRNFSLPVCLFI